MRAAKFFAGPLDGLLVDTGSMEPFKFAQGWAETITCEGVVWPFSASIISWNHNGCWDMQSDESGDIVVISSVLGQHEYRWCSVHREYEFEGAPARHV